MMKKLLIVISFLILLSVVLPASASLPNASVKLYLPLNGSYTDLSASAHTIRNNGTVFNTTTPVFGNASMYITNTSVSNLTLDGSSDFAFGVEDFGIYMWINITDYNALYMSFYDSRPSGTEGLYPNLAISSDGQLVYSTNNSVRIFGGTLSKNTPYYVALVKRSNVTELWVNGVQGGTSYTDTNNYINAADRPVIGSSGNAPTVTGRVFLGQIDDIVIVTGNGNVYTPSIVPDREFLTNPTSTFTVTPTSGTSPVTITLNNTSSGNTASTTYQWFKRNSDTGEEVLMSTEANYSTVLYGGNWSIIHESENIFGTTNVSSFVNVTPVDVGTISPISGYAFTQDSYADFVSGLTTAGFTPDDLGVGSDGSTHLWGIKVGNCDGAKPIILYTGVVHGEEWMSAYGVKRFMMMLKDPSSYPAQEPNLTTLTSVFDFYAIPVVNPSGYTNVTRVNANLVDINRNFDYTWAAYPTRAPPADDYKGTAAESENETKILVAKFNELDPAIIVDFHQQSVKALSLENGQYVSDPVIISEFLSLYSATESTLNIEEDTSKPMWYMWAASQTHAFAFESVMSSATASSEQVLNAAICAAWVMYGNQPVASFTASPTSGTVPLTVTFTDTSTNTPTSWSWDFGDGTTSTSQNPSHIYTTAGTWDVVLVSTNAESSDTETKSGYITTYLLGGVPGNLQPATGAATIVAALSLVGVMMISIGSMLIIGMFGRGGVMGRDGSATSPQGMTIGIIAIAIGAVLLFISYAILAPLFTVVGV